jgi:hypothetical protein
MVHIGVIEKVDATESGRDVPDPDLGLLKTDEKTHDDKNDERGRRLRVCIDSQPEQGQRGEPQYEDLSEAGDQVEWLNSILTHQLDTARRNDPANDREEDQ